MAHAASAVAASAAPVACLALLPPDALALVCAHYDTVRDAVRLAATCRDVGGVLAALPDVSRVIAAARQRGGTELAPTSTAARPPPPWLARTQTNPPRSARTPSPGPAAGATRPRRASSSRSQPRASAALQAPADALSVHPFYGHDSREMVPFTNTDPLNMVLKTTPALDHDAGEST